jgi:hypothetical protein
MVDASASFAKRIRLVDEYMQPVLIAQPRILPGKPPILPPVNHVSLLFQNVPLTTFSKVQ